MGFLINRKNCQRLLLNKSKSKQYKNSDSYISSKLASILASALQKVFPAKVMPKLQISTTLKDFYFIYINIFPTEHGIIIISIIKCYLEKTILGNRKRNIIIENSLIIKWKQELNDWQLFDGLIKILESYGIPFELEWFDSLPAIHIFSGQKKKLILGPIHSIDSASSLFIGFDKNLTRHFLSRLGSQFPCGSKVNNINDCKKVVKEIRYPVVLKFPKSSNSMGVINNIKNDQTLKKAIYHLRSLYPKGNLIMEKHIAGKYYRALIIDGVLIDVVTGYPKKIVSDGKNSIKKLLINNKAIQDYSDDFNFNFRLKNVLLSQGLELKDIPKKNKEIYYTPTTTNWENVMGKINIETKELLESICKELCPSIIGVEFICEVEVEEATNSNIKIIDLNTAPGIWFHNNQKFINELLLKRLLQKKILKQKIICSTIKNLDIKDILNKVKIDNKNIFLFYAEIDSIYKKGIPFSKCDVLILMNNLDLTLRFTLVSTIKQNGLLILDSDFQLSKKEYDIIWENEIFITYLDS